MDATAEKPSVGRLSLRLSTAGEYLLMLLVVFYSATWCLYTSANGNTALRMAVPLLAALIFLRFHRIPVALWQRVTGWGIYLAVYLLATRYNGVRFVLYFALPLLLLMLYAGLSRDGGAGLLHKLSDIVTVLTALSLFFFFFGTVLEWIPPSSVTAFYWGESRRTCPTYFHLYYAAQRIRFFGMDLPRNCGVFPEAPGFAGFLVVAVATEVLLRRRPRLWRCGLLVVAALTTLSAKALILTAAVFLLRYALWSPAGWRARRLRAVALPAVAAGMVGAAGVLLWDKLQTVSGGMRLDDVVACLKAFRTAPLFGTGYWNDASIVPYFAYPDRYNDGLSMGLAVLLAQGGLYLSALYWRPAVGCIRRCRPRRGWLSLVLVYTGLLLTGNITYHFLTLLLIAVFSAVGRERDG